jgi:hypothetical protein
VWRKRETPQDDALLSDVARWITRIDAKVDYVIELLEENDGEEEKDA